MDKVEKPRERTRERGREGDRETKKIRERRIEGEAEDDTGPISQFCGQNAYSHAHTHILPRKHAPREQKNRTNKRK